MTEKDYAFENAEGKCRFNKEKAAVQISDCNSYIVKSEDKLKQVLTNVGPLAIAVDARPLQNYHQDILVCDNSTEINHAVLLVGYGQEGDKPYWIVKNSWGENWGEQGYFRLSMYKNSCLLMSDVSSAVVV